MEVVTLEYWALNRLKPSRDFTLRNQMSLPSRHLNGMLLLAPASSSNPQVLDHLTARAFNCTKGPSSFPRGANSHANGQLGATGTVPRDPSGAYAVLQFHPENSQHNLQQRPPQQQKASSSSSMITSESYKTELCRPFEESLPSGQSQPLEAPLLLKHQILSSGIIVTSLYPVATVPVTCCAPVAAASTAASAATMFYHNREVPWNTCANNAYVFGQGLGGYVAPVASQPHNFATANATACYWNHQQGLAVAAPISDARCAASSH
ncbi:hypothetical protein A6R68_05404 [Neotoma lepida]|uniref:Uncharacterized protein n=1 Tax=Neotoma lepida TaxID=56216 RepID=A0A1A6GIL6_NEOLE|nr:hypothetical protein A6R68_05404 [Neotoma lepida]